MEKMKKMKQAKIILKSVDKFIQVNWNVEEYYLKAIVEGLKEVEKQKK